MAYAITVRNGIVHLRFFGVLGPDDIATATREVLKIEADSSVTPNRITDFTDATEFGLSTDHIRQLAASRRGVSFKNAFKAAIVVKSLVQFGHARMFQILNDHPQIRLAIFPTMEEAEAWIAEPGVAMPAKEYSPRQTPA